MKIQKIIIPRYIIPVFFLFFNAIMIIFTKEIFSGAQNGLKTWSNTVVPSLFPFMISIGIMINSGLSETFSRLLQPIFLKIFNLTGDQAFIFLTGLTAGCPLGLKTLAELYRGSRISRSEAHRLMLFCNNTGIMFILSAVGSGFWQNTSAGRKLLACSLLSIFTLAFLSGMTVKKQAAKIYKNTPPSFDQTVLSAAVSDSIRSVLTIGAYIIIFSVISKIFEILNVYDGLSAFLAPISKNKNLCRAAAIGLFEVTNGCKAAADGTKYGFVVSAAIIGWGGFCIHAQSIEFLKDTDLSCLPYLAGKVINSALCAFYAVLLF